MGLALTSELAERINRFFVDSNVSRACLCSGLVGNPLGASIQRFGKAVAIKYHAGGPMHINQALGLELEDLPHLDDILRFYQDDGLQGNLQLNALSVEPEQARFLAERQVFITSFVCTQYGLPCARPQSLTGIVFAASWKTT